MGTEKNEEALSFVRYTIENEGFDYAFRSYSEFKDVKDAEFHRLRKAYCKAADELQDYIGTDED